MGQPHVSGWPAGHHQVRARVGVGSGDGRVRGLSLLAAVRAQGCGEPVRVEGAREVQGGEGSGEEGERKGRASELSESQLRVSGTLKKKTLSSRVL